MTEPKAPYSDFLRALVSTQIQLWNDADAALRPLGIPLSHLYALNAIAEAGTVRASDLAATIGITVGAASKLIDRLERDGHCSRRANPDDRRSALVELTEAGGQTQVEGTAALEAHLASRLGPTVTGTERDELAAQLRSLSTAPATAAQGSASE
ncbi:MAG: MarR family winged helix-turn-helix transcriptional regulator [Pseudoclavibacter sp.]